MAHLLHQTFETQVRRIPDKTALVREGRRSSYADIDALSAALAASLRAQGIGRGDRVALFLDNSEHMVAALYAVLRIGAVFMPVNTLTKADKLAYVLADAEAAALVTQHALAEVARQALALAPGVRNCWLADDGYPAPAPARPCPPPGPAGRPPARRVRRWAPDSRHRPSSSCARSAPGPAPGAPPRPARAG